MNILEKFESDQIKELSKNKNFPVFKPGDTLKIFLKVKEGEKERIQMFEGVCIALKNAGINTSFSVRKISYGEGVERVFPIFSPQISKIEVAKFGDVRRSKLYYLRQRSGKSARITEKNKFLQQNKDVSEVPKETVNKSSKIEVDSKKNENSTDSKKVNSSSEEVKQDTKP
tara:strand:- start:251 stop:763 length:513 start_codon:yes stop_codon:yes gene_type:complete